KGDGKTNDTEALQHAVNEIDGVLELPRGDYLIRRPIVVPLQRTGFAGIRGDQGTARILMHGPGPAIHVVGNHQGTATPSTVKEHTWERERFPVISGFEIQGHHPEADGIQLYRTMQTTIREVLIRNCRYGIHLFERNRNFLLAQCHIYDNSDTGVFFDQCNLHQVIIIGNHISYCKRAGIRQLEGDVHNIQITGNDIEYNSGAEGLSGEIVLEATEGIISEFTISSNTLQATADASGANILVSGRAGKDSATAARLLNITGNVLGSRDRGVWLRNAIRVSITGNTIYGATRENLLLQNCHSTIIGSNTIGTRPNMYASNLKYRDGVRLEDCRDCVIHGNTLHGMQNDMLVLKSSIDCAINGNQLTNPHQRGIVVEDSARCRISDNSVVERSKHTRMPSAIEVGGESRSNLIQNNAVTKGLKAAIVCATKHGKTQGNVTWDGNEAE
ncbi:MAG: right-handed parallel beta-helix repeat-containing protein, partial [Verrucomicrobiota bacterium]|nr:right-handed parallel beta-helix repeat-containing protein [Verrucomicrobiota bacterium]